MSAAEVLQLEAWRDPDGVLRRAIRPRPAISHGWHDLHCFNAPGTRDKRTAVLIYARLGLHPILLHGIAEDGRCTCRRATCDKSKGKHPVHASWQTADLDVDALDAALTDNWRLNIGLRMGPQPGGFDLVCIDVDGGRELLAPLESQLGPLPPTLTATSGRGLHLIYRIADSATAPRNRTRIVPGVDVRSAGGQIVASPSLHQSGRYYRWTECRAPEVMR